MKIMVVVPYLPDVNSGMSHGGVVETTESSSSSYFYTYSTSYLAHAYQLSFNSCNYHSIVDKKCKSSPSKSQLGPHGQAGWRRHV